MQTRRLSLSPSPARTGFRSTRGAIGQPSTGTLRHGFLFEGFSFRTCSPQDVLRFAVVICLVIGLFGVEALTGRNDATFVGKRLGNLGGILYYFQLYLWAPLAVVSGIWQLRRNPRVPRVLMAHAWPAALAVFVLFSATYSEAPEIAHVRTAVFLQRVLPVVVCALVCADLKSVIYVRDTILLYAVVAFVAFMVAPEGLSAILHGRSLSTEGYNPRLVIQNNEIETGYQLALIFLVAWLVRRSAAVGGGGRHMLLTIMLVALVLLLFNSTRGAIVGLVAAVIAIASLRRARLAVTAVALIGIFVGGLFVVKAMPRDLAERYLVFDPGDSAFAERTEYSLEALSAPPTLMGRGLGSFGAERAGELNPVYTHNATTEMYYEGGLVGLGLFLVACGTVFARLWRVARASNGAAAEFCLAGLVVFLAFSQSSGTLMSISGLWVFLALGSTCAAQLKQRNSPLVTSAARDRRPRAAWMRPGVMGTLR